MSSPFAFTKGQRLKCQLQSLFIVASLHNHSADKSTLSNNTPPSPTSPYIHFANLVPSDFLLLSLL